MIKHSRTMQSHRAPVKGKRCCKVCKRSTKKNKRICSTECETIDKENKRLGYEVRKMKEAVKVRKERRFLKEKAVAYKGGSCIRCGYNRNQKALEFHHRNPKEKDYSISSAATNKVSWDFIKIELDKCDLVCANCHREIHDEM